MGSSKIIIQNLKGTVYFFTASPQGEGCCPNRVARLSRLAGIKAQTGNALRKKRHQLPVYGTTLCNQMLLELSPHPNQARTNSAQNIQNTEEARRDVFDYIEMFYNPKRKHANNGLLSSVDFERQHK